MEKSKAGGKKTETDFELRVTIPANSGAIIYLPAKHGARLQEGQLSVDKTEGLKLNGFEKDRLKVQVGSGTYHFIISDQKL